MGAVWTASGDGILLLAPADSAGRKGVNALQNEQSRWALLRFPVSPDGRVRLPPDTVTSELRLPGAPTIGNQTALSPPSRSGAHALGLTSVSFSLSTVERPSFTAPPARKAKLVTGAAGRFQARISPDGEHLLVLRQVMLGVQPATQLEILPFAGGSGTPLGPSRKGVRHATWSTDAKTVYLLAAGAPGQLEQVALDAASGRPRWSRTVPDSLDWQTWLMRDSLLLYRSVGSGSNGTPREWRSYPGAGEVPLVFSFPDTAAWMNADIVSPDGQGSWLGALITASWGAASEKDTFTLQVARPGAPAERVSVFTGMWRDLTFVYAAPGPVFEVVGDLMSGGQRRLLLEPGRPPRDLGPMPVPWAHFSADGRRGVLIELESQQSDIWLLRWPGGDSAGAGGTK
jgi:hypothetical protein